MNTSYSKAGTSIQTSPSSRDSSIGSEPCSVVTTARSSSTIASRPPSAQKANRTGPQWFTMSCNKCQKAIDSTVFVCSCKCMFCEDCTYSHFQSSETCPQCGFRLTADDFTEIMVSDPNGAPVNQYEVIQNPFTKTSNEPGEPITWNEMCTALMKEHDAILVNTKIFVKQFLRETQRTMQEGRIAKNQAQAYQKQLVAMKQDTIHLRAQYEQSKKQIHEKDRQIQQLKTMLARANDTQSQRIEFTKQMHEKDRQIQHLKQLLSQSQQSEPSSSRSFLGQRPHHYASERAGPSRSNPGQLHRQESSRSSSRSGGPGSSRSMPGQLQRHGSFPIESSRSATDVCTQRPGSFHEFVLKKETREVIQERELLMNRKRKNTAMFD